MKKSAAIWKFIICIAIMVLFAVADEVKATEVEIQSPAAEFTLKATDGNSYVRITREASGWETAIVWNGITKVDSQSVTMTAVSSDESVIKIEDEFKESTYHWGIGNIKFHVVGEGCATITVQAGECVRTIDVYVVPKATKVKKIEQTGYSHITLNWQKLSGCAGYEIQRSIAGKNKFTTIHKVSGAAVTSAEIFTNWNKEYSYRVVGYVVEKNGKRVLGETGSYKNFTVKKLGAVMKSVNKTGKSSFKIQWSKVKGALGYELYRSTSENGTYKKIYTASGENKTSYTQKVQLGQTYYYYVITKYAEGKSDASDSISGYIPKKSKTLKVAQNQVSDKLRYSGQYAGNWALPDTTYYYVAGSKLYMVCLEDHKLKIYTLSDSKLKPTATKSVDLGAFDAWGGFYHGIDGCFYVAVGYKNLEERDSKTVIKVYQYSSKWKLKKTCNIKGSASNAFKGIWVPFDAGNCRMDMTGTTLYLFTARTMYAGSDGVHHQSNISFKINTKTMKYKEANESYVSHSFNQFAKFKDGDLYLVDHGDAYPRSVSITMVKNYGKTEQMTQSESVFTIRGKIGDNATGVTIGGVEVGKDNVMICGTAMPHNSKVAGVTGWDGSWKKNVYVIVVNKKTGKKSIKWLTQNNPKTSTTTVDETRMVKLSDSYFAILYNTTTAGGVTKLNYVVVNNSGKKVYSKVYSDMSCKGTSQPILYKGNIIWTESVWGKSYEKETVTYRIPAIY